MASKKSYPTLAAAKQAAGKGKIIRLQENPSKRDAELLKQVHSIYRKSLEAKAEITGYENDATEDIQHDLALSMAHGDDDIQARIELQKRGAKIPYSVRLEKGPYAPKLGSLRYEVNPRGKRIKIYNRVIKIYASKAGMPHQCDAECKKHGHNYVHHFKEKACIYGLPDGSLLVK